MKFRRIDVLLNEETGERFNCGDIVHICMKCTYLREYEGRIAQINTLDLLLDYSSAYHTRTAEISLDEIHTIVRI
jgi:hypothetical protein